MHAPHEPKPSEAQAPKPKPDTLPPDDFNLISKADTLQPESTPVSREANTLTPPDTNLIRSADTLGANSNHPASLDFGGLPSIAGYEVLSEIGRGGAGVVYKARHLALGRTCAIKMILGEHVGRNASIRFHHEAGIISRLNHPNIVKVHTIGEHKGVPYFELEFMEGGSLAGKINGTPWAPDLAAEMVATIAEAVGEAHRAGVIHRDLKPDNILLAADDSPKVSDFGLAKTADSVEHLTITGTLMGTPEYMAPEQAAGKVAGAPTDVHALGLILYEILTGLRAYQAATRDLLLAKIGSEDPVSPAKQVKGLPRDLETICLKCLEKVPERRYASGCEVAHDLRRFLNNESILARRATPIERLFKWSRRNRKVAALLAMLTVGLVLGKYLLQSSTIRPTRAMQLSWDRHEEVRRLWEACRKYTPGLEERLVVNPINPEVSRLEKLCRDAYREYGLPDLQVKILPPGKRPDEADLTKVGVQSIARHSAFDCSEWEPLASEREVREVPKEAAFSTSVYHFRRQKAGELRIAIEFNSGGFGVVPLLQPGDELQLGTKPMTESGHVTKTTYLIRTIPASRPDDFEVTLHAIYFNGFQDQQVRREDSDWCAMRIFPGCAEASLAFMKPKRRIIRSISKIERVENSADTDHGAPASFSKAAGDRLAEQEWYVWPIDTEDLTKPTVYSMRWKLKPSP